MMNSNQNTQDYMTNAEYVAEYYQNHTPEQMATQIKRYESTAQTHLNKADRCWAYAKNGKGGYYYNVARNYYGRAEDNLEKGEALQKMLDAKTNTIPTKPTAPSAPVKSGNSSHSVTPNTSTKSGNTVKATTPNTSTLLSGMGKSGLIGAAVAGSITAITGAVNGDDIETIAEESAANAVAGGVSGVASHAVGVGVSTALNTAIAGTALGATAAAPFIPVAGAVVAGAAVGETAFRIGKGVVDGIKDGILFGDIGIGLESVATSVGLELEDMWDSKKEKAEKFFSSIGNGIEDLYYKIRFGF